MTKTGQTLIRKAYLSLWLRRPTSEILEKLIGKFWTIVNIDRSLEYLNIYRLTIYTTCIIIDIHCYIVYKITSKDYAAWVDKQV